MDARKEYAASLYCLFVCFTKTKLLFTLEIVLQTKNNHKTVSLTRFVSVYALSYWWAIFNQTSKLLIYKGNFTSVAFI